MLIHTKTRKSARIVFCFFVASICISCTSVLKAEKPLWADSFSVNQVFPSSEYITALGYAKKKEMAASVADGNLASYFSKEVSATTRADQRLSSTEEARENISREIIIKSQIELFGIKHTEYYFDSQSKNYIICAYISREDAWAVLEPKLNIHYSSLSKNISHVKNQKGLKAVINAKKILSNTSDFEDLYYTALFIFPNRCEKYSNLMENITNLKQRLPSLTREVKIKINTKGDGDGRIYSKISSLVTDAGFTVCKSGENHIMSVNVDIEEQITGKVHSIYPKVSVVVSDGKEAVSSFSKSLDKVAAFNSTSAQKMALSRIEDLLEEEFAETCLK